MDAKVTVSAALKFKCSTRVTSTSAHNERLTKWNFRHYSPKFFWLPALCLIEEQRHEVWGILNMGILQGSKIVGVWETENFIYEELNTRLETRLCSTLWERFTFCHAHACMALIPFETSFHAPICLTHSWMQIIWKILWSQCNGMCWNNEKRSLSEGLSKPVLPDRELTKGGSAIVSGCQQCARARKLRYVAWWWQLREWKPTVFGNGFGRCLTSISTSWRGSE